MIILMLMLLVFGDPLIQNSFDVGFIMLENTLNSPISIEIISEVDDGGRFDSTPKETGEEFSCVDTEKNTPLCLSTYVDVMFRCQDTDLRRFLDNRGLK